MATVRLDRARHLALSLLGIGHQFRYNDSDVSSVCRRLRIGYDKINPERHQQDRDLADEVETLWRLKAHD